MARFYSSQYINPRSAYVPLPFEPMAANLQALQQKQDQYQQNVELLDKPFGALAIDLEGATAEREKTRSDLENLRNLDYNDPSNKRQIFDTIRNVRDSYGPQGTKGLMQNRLDQFNAAQKHIQDTYKDNPTQQGYLMGELNKQFYVTDPNTGQIVTDPVTGKPILDKNKELRFNEQTGQYENTGIETPQEWTWVDRESWASNTLKDIEADQNYQNYGFSNVQGMESAIKAFREGNRQHKDYNKIENAMILRAQGNPGLLKSTQAEGEYYGYGDQSNWLVEDEQGNTMLNPTSLLGKTIMGTGEGGEFERTTANTQFVRDEVADARKKKMIEDPLSYIGREVPATNYINTVDTGEKLGTRIEGNKVNTETAWVDMMRDNPQMWDKYNMRGADGKFDENRAKASYQATASGPLGIDGWMKINGTNFGNSAGKVNGLIAENKKLTIVDDAANKYADKVVGAAPSTENIVPIKNLTKEETAEFYNLNSGSAKWRAEHIDNPDVKKEDIRIQELYKKTFGVSPSLTSSGTVSQVDQNKLEAELDKTNPEKDHLETYSSYNENRKKVKDGFVKTNAETISKETYAEGVMPVLNPDGSVNTNATFDINTQVNKYFTDGTSMNTVVTLEPKDPANPSGGYYTLADIKAEEEAKAKEEGGTGEVKISKPWYSSLPDAQGNPIMYVTVGTRDVPVNSNSLTVTYQPTPGSEPVKTTIGQLNDSPTTRTNTFLSGVYSSGSGTSKVGGFPLESNPNVRIFTAGKPENGSWSGGTELKIIEYDASGKEIYSKQGNEAFLILMDLEQQGKLK